MSGIFDPDRRRSRSRNRARHVSQPGVTALGHVPDIRPHLSGPLAAWSRYASAAAPGSRSRRLGHGYGYRSTSIGCEGLDAVDGENILIRDNPSAFSDAVLHVLEESELRSRLESNGRETAARVYDWSVVGRGMRREHSPVMNAYQGV